MTDNDKRIITDLSDWIDYGDNNEYLLSEVLDLINRQQAENDNLNIELQAMRISANSFKSKYKSAVDTAKQLRAALLEKDDDIERLTIKMNAFGLGMKSLKEDMEKAKAEAIKEFAERLKEKQQTFTGDEYVYKFIYLIEIDNLAKEMVGEE